MAEKNPLQDVAHKIVRGAEHIRNFQQHVACRVDNFAQVHPLFDKIYHMEEDTRDNLMLGAYIGGMMLGITGIGIVEGLDTRRQMAARAEQKQIEQAAKLAHFQTSNIKLKTANTVADAIEPTLADDAPSVLQIDEVIYEKE